MLLHVLYYGKHSTPKTQHTQLMAYMTAVLAVSKVIFHARV
jgi:hypothetical protein